MVCSGAQYIGRTDYKMMSAATCTCSIAAGHSNSGECSCFQPGVQILPLCCSWLGINRHGTQGQVEPDDWTDAVSSCGDVQEDERSA